MKYPILLLIVLIVFSLCLFAGKTVVKNAQNEFELQLSQRNEYFSRRQRMLYLHASYIRLPSMNTLIKDANGNELHLKDVLSSKLGTLVYRFTYRMCFECINAEFENLNMVYKRRGKGSIIILTSYVGENDLKLVMNNIKTEIPAYNIPYGQMEQRIDELNMPYLFYVNQKELDGSMLFFPEKSEKSWSNQYYSDILSLAGTDKTR